MLKICVCLLNVAALFQGQLSVIAKLKQADTTPFYISYYTVCPISLHISDAHPAPV